MIEKVNIENYAELIQKELKTGILLNTNGDKFDSMVIGWGHLGILWSRPTFVVYVRESRYTKSQLDKTGEFTVSVPLSGPIPEFTRVLGTLSARDIDKVKEAGLTLCEPQVNNTPGIAEYPLTIECKVLYSQKEDLALIPEDIRNRFYPENGEQSDSSCDPHTMYVGEIVSTYLIKD